MKKSRSKVAYGLPATSNSKVAKVLLTNTPHPLSLKDIADSKQSARQGEERLNHIFIKDKDCYRKIFFKDILCIEASGSYCQIYMATNLQLCITYNLAEFTEWLPGSIFIRTHRSYLVNVEHVDLLMGNLLCLKGFKIPIGRSYRKEVLSKFNILGRGDLQT